MQQTVTQTYDIWNQWIRRQVDSGSPLIAETYFIYDAGQMVMRFNALRTSNMAQGRISSANRYLWGPAVDQLLAEEGVRLQGSEGTLWQLTDNLGSVRDLAEYDEASGTTSVVNHITYDSFGNVTNETAAVDHLFGYTGRAYDEETDLQNNHNRWYDAASGRWLSEDPIGFAAGDANLYRYVGNSATGETDPSGLAERKVLQWGDFTPVDKLSSGLNADADTNIGDWSFRNYGTKTIESSVEEKDAATAMKTAKDKAKTFDSRILTDNPAKIDELIRMKDTQRKKPCDCKFVAVAKYTTPPDVSFPGGGNEVLKSYLQERKKEDDTIYDSLLAHEQGHHDIDFIYHRAMTEELGTLFAIGVGCSKKSAETLAQNQLNNAAKKIAKEYINLMFKENEIYHDGKRGVNNEPLKRRQTNLDLWTNALKKTIITGSSALTKDNHINVP